MDGNGPDNRAAALPTSAALAVIVLMSTILVGSGDRTRVDVQANPLRLEWSLFRRVDSIPGSSEDARIATEMSFPQPLKIERVRGEYRLPSFTISVAPEPEQTMVRRSAVLTEYLLLHEQGHYDIVVLAVRALAQELETMTAASPEELSHRAEECVDKHMNRAKALSEAYDRETDRSRKPATQARWIERIAAAMSDPRARSLAGLPL